jgi:nucleotide-binding universal stress UspA family protein
MGRDRILTNWLNEVHERFRTPYRAIVTTGVVIVVLIAADVPIGTLAEVASFSYLVTYALVHVAVVVMRRANPDAYEPAFRIPGRFFLYPAVPIVGFVACILVLVGMRPLVQGIGSAIVLLGVAWYAVYARERGTSESLVGEALAPTPDTAAANGQGRYRVVVPIANPETERDLLRLAAASAHAHEHDAELVAVNVIAVPPQTSLEQEVEFEEERIERQRELLDHARDIAADLDVGIRTRAVVGRNVGDVVLDVIEEENADHVLLGWTGSRSAREHILGSNIDPIVEHAPCEVTLVKIEGDEIGRTVALAGEGPHAPVAAKRAAELVSSAGESADLTLLNVQEPTDDGDPEAAGREAIGEVAERAGIEYVEHEPRVVVAEDVRDGILEVVDAYDTVCVGATRDSAVSQALFGSLPETIGERADATVAMVRGPTKIRRSIREAVLERLGSRKPTTAGNPPRAEGNPSEDTS